jgi:type IV pilus assembly protein PilX
MHMLHYRRTFARQQGAILIVSMLLLLVLTVLAISTMRASTFQERMAGNVRDVGLSFQSTESAVREAEAAINDPARERPTLCTALTTCDLETEVFEPGVLPDVRNQDDSFWNDNGVEYGETPFATPGAGVRDLGRVVADPQYTVEQLGFDRDSFDPNEPDGRYVYRIYGRGPGGTNIAQSVVESTFTRRF